MNKSLLQEVKQLQKIAGILKENEDFDLSDNPLNITKRKDNQQERDEILNGVKYQFDIKDAVQEFLGWSEERAKLATERDWDEVVDAIIDSPGLKSRFIDVDPELGHLVYEDDDFDLLDNPLDYEFKIGDVVSVYEVDGEFAEEGVIVDIAKNFDQAKRKKSGDELVFWEENFSDPQFADYVGYDEVDELKNNPWYKVKGSIEQWEPQMLLEIKIN